MPVPQPPDKSETSTLPDPELNPLLNPLLAENLGRWAEVYFTSPPENRTQAVSELLRELQNGSPASVQVIQDENRNKMPETEEGLDPPPPAAELRTCNACGHDNLAAQKFCGMCGAPLPTAPEEQTIEPTVSSVEARGHDAQESPWMLADTLRSFAVASEPEPVPNHYRLYGAIVLAVVLTLLLYTARRGARTISGPAEVQSADSRALPTALPAEPADSPRPSATESAPLEADHQDSTAPSQQHPAANSRKNRTAAVRATSPDITIAAHSSAPTAEQGVAEDFATAEKYLSGSQGMPRDSREASLWLWKAVGKGNLAATVALSDLYLRGDGVPKNCDQGRLLLDAAARKGSKAAAERLRNLQAFGCE